MYEFLRKEITKGVCDKSHCCIYSENFETHILTDDNKWEFSRDIEDGKESFQLYFETSNELHLWQKFESSIRTSITDYTLTLGNGVKEYPYGGMFWMISLEVS